uniref:Uncharacterized protein n=1 Tax=Arundo donax TaxID=35708 RepID=A0A0A9CBW0_ARUDO
MASGLLLPPSNSIIISISCCYLQNFLKLLNHSPLSVGSYSQP